MPSPALDTYLLLRAFVDELVRCGVTHACTSPGSRSTPLVLSLVRDGRLRCTSHLDERAGAFFGLGLAKATRRPVVLACTSGTAAAEYLPAVVEAHEAGVPLLVLTADRPYELREVGAGQTIDQVKLYGDAARWFVEVGVGHEASAERVRWLRALACRAVWTSAGSGGERPGPVHLNWPLREPLVLDAPLGEAPDPRPGRPGAAPWLARPRPAPASSAQALREALAGARRPLVVAGRLERDPALPAALAAFAEGLGAPLLADPLSGARRGAAAIAHYDALLRDERFAAAQRPDVVVRVGDLPTSKPLRSWLAGLEGARQVAFDPEGVWHDPDAVLEAVLPGDPSVTLAELSGASGLGDPASGRTLATPGGSSATGDPGWLAGWRAADAAAAQALDAALGDGLSEPGVARELVAALDADATLVVASSMPIRDVETFAAARPDGGPRVLANRGANGIDGTVSTAFGVAASGTRTVLLIGDVALAYDTGGLLAARRLAGELTIVVLDNEGGGIFEFLAVAGERDAFEEHVATPPNLDLAQLAAVAGLRHERPTTPAQLRAALLAGGRALVEVRSDRRENVALHRRAWAAVAQALRS